MRKPGVTEPVSLLLLPIALLCSVFPVLAQQGPPKVESVNPTFAIDTQLVQVYMTVTEGSRRVTDLKAEDFAIFEDGAPVQMDRLDAGRVPLQVALLFDISGSMRDALPVTAEAATYFIESLDPGDRVTLITFNSDIRVIPQLSDDRTPILHAIRASQARGGTKLYESLLFAMKHLSGKEGRKAIVSFSDGEDTARSSSLDIVLNAAARYGYPLYAVGAGAGLRRDTLKKILRQLSEINSGKSYFVEDPRDLRSAFAEVGQELRSAYVLNYYTSVPFDGRWHDIKIQVGNPKYKIHSRKGFYARSGGGKSVFAEPFGPKGHSTMGFSDRSGAAVDYQELDTASAVSELTKTPVPTRELEPDALLEALPAAPPKPAKTPVYKVESRLVEVPVLLESTSGKELPALSQKDFRVYEDDSLREIVFFTQDFRPDNRAELREAALKKLKAADPGRMSSEIYSDSGDLLLARFYLLFDDWMSETGAFLRAKVAAGKIIREYAGSGRKLSVHLTSETQAEVGPQEDLKAAIQKVNRTSPKADRELTTNDSFMNVHEAYLIERGDLQATQLAELRLASDLQLQYKNDLGEVEGQDNPSPEMIRINVQNRSRELVAGNFSRVARVLDSLNALVNAASADPGEHLKIILLVSSGFSVGRGSGRGDVSMLLDGLVKLAKQSGVHIYSLDPSGLVLVEQLGIGANGAFLVRNPHLSALLESHAHDWRMDRESPLAQLALETGGKFIHSTNDLVAGAATVLKTCGQTYYLGYLSRQPPDGRFHRIRVTSSLNTARVHARKGYYAGRKLESDALTGADLEGEDWQLLMDRANQALKAGDLKQFAAVLEKLVRRFPNRAPLWQALGAAQLNLGEPQQAVAALQKAFALSPEDKAIGLTLSRAFIAAGLGEAAAQTMEMVAQRNPRDIGILMQLGRTYEAAGKTGEAHRTYRGALDVGFDPPPELYLVLTRTSVRLGRVIEARLFVDDFLARGGAPADIDPWRQLIPNNAP